MKQLLLTLLIIIYLPAWAMEEGRTALLLSLCERTPELVVKNASNEYLTLEFTNAQETFMFRGRNFLKKIATKSFVTILKIQCRIKYLTMLL